MSEDRIRLFAGWFLPPSLHERIRESLASVRDDLPRASWPRLENLHVTFAFFGATEPKRAEEMAAVLKTSLRGVAPIHAALLAAAAIPPRRPRVGWIALDGGDELGELAAAVRASADEAGVTYDAKPFRAHVTLARFKERYSKEDVTAFCESCVPLIGEIVTIDHVALIRSDQVKGGVRYSDFSRIQLGDQQG